MCRPTTSCQPVPPHAAPEAGFGLTALAPLPGSDAVAYLERAFDPARGNRIALKIVATPLDAGSAIIDTLILQAPLTRDNFEGAAAVAAPGGVRFFLLSDDNFNSTQRTLLLAFDWKPESR